MTVDLSKIKPGDEVLVRVKVVELHENDQWPLIVDLHPVTQSLALVQPGKPFDGKAYVGQRAIVSHTPKALAVGDRVKAQFGFTWTIVAIHNGWAWLGDEDDSGVLRRLSELERVDA